jgi:glycyl-tRNA synthetase beta chain
MPELLLEIFSEEIPARMQQDAVRLLHAKAKEQLDKYKICGTDVNTYITPRRMVLHIENLPEMLAAQTTMRKGPKVGANEHAINGFLRSTGLSFKELVIEQIGNDQFYVANIEQPAMPIAVCMAEAINEILRTFTWPKSMRWTDSAATWVRPIRRIMCILDGTVLPIEFIGIKASNISSGHRFIAPEEFVVSSFNEYVVKLKQSYVILDQAERRQRILDDAIELAARYDMVLKDDETLIQELTGLVEWPYVLIGKIDDEFLDVPSEALATTMRSNQKYISLYNKEGKFMPNFIFVAATIPHDNGEVIIGGNEKVLRARLSDAKFFWNSDLKHKLEYFADKLSSVTFHAKLGSMMDKTNRLIKLVEFLAEKLSLDESLKQSAKRAALFSKADLTSGMVGEFPELQGVMGRYYALKQGENQDVADAIRDHYLPVGSGDMCPIKPVSYLLAIADKIDSLVGLSIAGERATGSKDPFALRRMALGIVRIVIDNKLNIEFDKLVEYTSSLYTLNNWSQDLSLSVEDYLIERLRYYLKGKHRYDVICSVLASASSNIYDNYNKILAIEEFIRDVTNKDIISSYKRVENILKAQSSIKPAQIDEKLLVKPAEKELYNIAMKVNKAVRDLIAKGDIKEALMTLKMLDGAISQFFDGVMVNAEDANLRQNRQAILTFLKEVFDLIADFSHIEDQAL